MNKRRLKYFVLCTVIGLMGWQNLFAQDRTRILFILDASLSMGNAWKGGTKWNVATTSLVEIADSLSRLPNIEMGLRVFGHVFPEPDKNCHDSRLEVPIDSHTVDRIKKRLENLRPKGITPLVYSIEKGALDFGDGPGKNIIVIITDGEDACDRDPCSIIPMLQQHNVFLKPFIIGMSLEPMSFQNMKCMGKVFNTNSAEEFNSTLKDVVNDFISKTTLQVNLNDANGKPTETNADMTFYDQETGTVKYNLYHTLNARGLPDTLVISPAMKYKLQVHTIPPIVFDNLELKKNQHNVVNVKAPQGYLNFVLQGNVSKTTTMDRIKCMVHKPDDPQTLHVQRINTKEKYINGTYDLDVLTLPRITVKGVKIDQSKTTDVQIPSPGIITINKTFEAYGGIFVVENKRMKKIYDLHLKERQENLSLQPGKYHIVYRSKLARTIHTTVDKEFEIASGGSLSLKL